MITFNVKTVLPFDEAEALHRLNLESGGLVQQTIDKAVIDWNIPYCPFESGTLAYSPYSVTAIGSGEVVYPGPYARYQYYGEVYGPNIPVFDDNTGIPTGFWSPPNEKKHPTGRPLECNTEKNPLAGPFWFERMKADHLDDIVKEAGSVVGARS